MLQTMRKYNPGRLRHVSLHFHSPPVGNDSVAWLRDERRARTLLMDYALHFVDLACMFGDGPWAIDSLRHELNSSGQTELIEGHLTRSGADGGAISAAILLRQGFGPRRARVDYAFQNYSVSLRFFPDTFALSMADDNAWQHKREYAAALKATMRKVVDRVTNRESDQSHALAIAGSFDARSGLMSALTVQRIAPFYDLLFRIADRVYGPQR
jgi:predicted dehydrogenase